MTTLSYYVPKHWELVAAIDDSQSYEVDVTEVWYDPSTEGFVLATASGCSCWDGSYDTEEFVTLAELFEALSPAGIDRPAWASPSLNGVADLRRQANDWEVDRS